MDNDVLNVPEATSTAPLRRVGTPDSSVNRVFAEIRRAVMNGSLPSGSAVSITSLSNGLGVSHIPVREALQRLEAQGLVTLRPGRSALINPLDREELRAIYRLRKLIEPDLGARACADLTPDDLEEAGELLRLYVDPLRDAEDRWALHRELHLRLMGPAVTEWDRRILDQLWQSSERYTRVVYETHDVGEVEMRRRETAHRILIDTAATGSAVAFKQAIFEHLAAHEVTCLEWMAALDARESAAGQ